jgi:periplasmic protein TonB
VTAATFVYAPDRRGEILRWGGAALVILLAHLAAGVVYQLRERSPAAQAEMPAIEIDLTPPQVEEPAPDLPMPPPVEEIKPEVPPPEPQVMEEPREPPPPEPQVMEEPKEPPPPDPLPPEPEPVQAEQPLPEPPPPPKPVEVQPPKEPTIVTPPPKPVVKREPPRRPPSPPKKLQPATAPQTGAPSAGAAAGQADWRNRVMATLARAKRYPSGAQSRQEAGTVQLSFTVDRNGRVLSRQIARSSGFADLDREVLSILDRVQLPAFPPEMTQPRMTVTAPINFTLR